MKYWRINTDREARNDVQTCDLWYEHGMAFAGDYDGGKYKHMGVFKKMRPGDGVLMHHSKAGIVGYGFVDGEWDGIVYEGDHRLLYRKERYEYRIRVMWAPEYDRRISSLPISGILHTGPIYYGQIDPNKYDIDGILRRLETVKQKMACKDAFAPRYRNQEDNRTTEPRSEKLPS
jgi:hypothetical protein